MTVAERAGRDGISCPLAAFGKCPVDSAHCRDGRSICLIGSELNPLRVPDELQVRALET